VSAVVPLDQCARLVEHVDQWKKYKSWCYVFRSGVDQPRLVRVAGGLNGAGDEPPVKCFAVLLRQVGNKVRRVIVCEARSLDHRMAERRADVKGAYTCEAGPNRNPQVFRRSAKRILVTCWRKRIVGPPDGCVLPPVGSLWR
jgi:hypothetical protein